MATQNTSGVASISVLAFSRYTPTAPDRGTPSAWFYGGILFPLAATSANSLLQDADPALFQALAFYAFVLNKYLGPRFVTESAAVAYQDSKQQPISSLVEAQVAYNPLP